MRRETKQAAEEAKKRRRGRDRDEQELWEESPPSWEAAPFHGDHGWTLRSRLLTCPSTACSVRVLNERTDAARCNPRGRALRAVAAWPGARRGSGPWPGGDPCAQSSGSAWKGGLPKRWAKRCLC